MDQASKEQSFRYCESYPQLVIVIRWIILGTIFALGVYILWDIREVLGLAYIIYSLAALTLVLSLSRCASCFYYGRACNTGWGRVAAYLFPKGDESRYVENYSYSVFLHLLWLIPLGGGLFQLARSRSLVALCLVAGYAFLLLVEKIALKKLACVRCHQREFCPALPFRKTG
jgi:hypothetical protein